MDIYSIPPIAAVLDAAYSVVINLQDLLDPIAADASAGVSIVLITLILRLMMIPVGRSQVRADFVRARLAPRLQLMRKRYKNTPALLKSKTAQLYKDEGANPNAGQLPTLIQALVLSVVYALFVLTSINGHANALLTATIFRIPLGESFAHLVVTGTLSTGSLVFPALLLLLATAAYFSRRANKAFQAPLDHLPPEAARLLPYLSWAPFAVVVFAPFVPLAATIYLAVTTVWSVIERRELQRRIGRREPAAAKRTSSHEDLGATARGHRKMPRMKCS